MDIAFLLDASNSVGESGYQKQKDFAKLISENIVLSPTGSRFGVITYSTEARLDIAFEEYLKADELKAAIDVLQFQGGLTRMDKALNVAWRNLFTFSIAARPGIPKVVVLLTDGKETPIIDYERLSTAVTPFKRSGIAILAIGIGPNADLQELRTLVSMGDNVLVASTFNDLANMALNLTSLVCKVAGNYITLTVNLIARSFVDYLGGLSP